MLTAGRIGVDVYPQQVGVSLREVTSFGKFLGGSPTNVAVAAARYGRSAAVITGVGADPFGAFLRDALRGFGVDDRYVLEVPGLPTPVTFCELFPPDDFPLYFYRAPKAPDLEITAEALDREAIRSAGVFWATVTGLSQEPSRAATLAALAVRERAPLTVLDLDWRPMLWADPAEAPPHIAAALEHATVAVGNLEECRVATGESDPRAAGEALHARGVEIVVVKRGRRGPRLRRHGLDRGSAGAGGGRQRARRGRRVRRRAVPRAAGGLGPRAHHRLRQRSRRDRRRAAELRRRHADRGGGARVRDDLLRRPEAVARAAATRVQPATVDRHLIVAADHPARGALGAGGDPLAMADRGELLERLTVALAHPGVTGVLGTADIVDDLLLLGALDGKTVFGSMNRGGIAGAAWELDDTFTGYDARALAEMGFQGGKMLMRVDLEDPATPRTLEACGAAVTDLARAGLTAMVEPFWTRREADGKLRTLLDAESAIKASTIAAGLGASSAYTWLKVPVVDEMERLVAATTLPTLLLGGEVDADQDAAFARWQAALALPNVIGLVVGRSLLYPPGDDVAAAVGTAVGLLS